MLSWLYDALMSIVAFVLGLFGVSMDKKSVTFAEDGEKKEEESPAAKDTNVRSSDAPEAVAK